MEDTEKNNEKTAAGGSLSMILMFREAAFRHLAYPIVFA
jgi:hypothetical protein